MRVINNDINNVVDCDCHAFQRADACEKGACSAASALLLFMMRVLHPPE